MAVGAKESSGKKDWDQQEGLADKVKTHLGNPSTCRYHDGILQSPRSRDDADSPEISWRACTARGRGLRDCCEGHETRLGASNVLGEEWFSSAGKRMAWP